VIRPSGLAESVKVDVPYTETRQVGALERLQTRRQLVAVEGKLLAAHEVYEIGPAAEETAARRRRNEAIEAGEVALRRMAPDLIRAVRTAQRLAETWHQQIADLDDVIGGPRPVLLNDGRLPAIDARASARCLARIRGGYPRVGAAAMSRLSSYERRFLARAAPAPRRCLGCGRTFANPGPQCWLCSRCQPPCGAVEPYPLRLPLRGR